MNEPQSFEQKINDLDNILTTLENNELSLEDSVKLYEKGFKLSEECHKLLETAELEITKITGETQNKGETE